MRVVSRSRGVRAAVALAYLVGYLLVFAHFAEERHVTCVEHDTSHHAEATGDVGVARSGIAALPAADDDHCSLLQLVRSPIASPVAAHGLMVEQASASTTPTKPLESSNHAPLSPWRYAPKTSPPSRSS